MEDLVDMFQDFLRDEQPNRMNKLLNCSLDLSSTVDLATGRHGPFSYQKEQIPLKTWGTTRNSMLSQSHAF